MAKKYIEFLLHNKEHLNKLKELDNLYDTINREMMEGDFSDAYEDKKHNEVRKLVNTAKKLIDKHYYYDADIDVSGTIRLEWEDLVVWENVNGITDIIHAIETEQANRIKRKRPYPKMWEKLEQLGLARRK